MGLANRLLGIALAFPVVCAALSMSSGSLYREEMHLSEITLPAADFFADGDVVFRRGTDPISTAVLAFNREYQFSHVGMIVIRNSQPLVIHATPPDQLGVGGVHSQTLDSFARANNVSGLAVYRIVSLDPGQRRKVRDYLYSQLGKPFDLRLSYTDNSQHYCTELVLKALEHAGLHEIPSLPRVSMLAMAEAAFPPDSVRSLPHIKRVWTPMNLSQPTANPTP